MRPAAPEDFDGSWQFCRVAFRQNRNGDGGGWSVDYPRADINMSIRLSELTKTTVSFAGPQEPNHVVIRLTDPTLFQCPFIMMTEVGAAFIDDAEAEALRNYLLKGGFLWADDFWGEWAWEAWAEQIGKALAAGPVSARKISRRIIRCSARSSTSAAACRRSRRSAIWLGTAAAPRSAARRARCRTRAASSISQAA